MRAKKATAVVVIAWAAFGVQARAQAPCAEYLRLRNAATEAWTQAMRVSPSERCWALREALTRTEATLNYAQNNRGSCGISQALFERLETHRRDVEKTRLNVCSGRPLRPFPPDIAARLPTITQPLHGRDQATSINLPSLSDENGL